MKRKNRVSLLSGIVALSFVCATQMRANPIDLQFPNNGAGQTGQVQQLHVTAPTTIYGQVQFANPFTTPGQPTPQISTDYQPNIPTFPPVPDPNIITFADSAGTSGGAVICSSDGTLGDYNVTSGHTTADCG